ncbi:putative 2-oxoglutarate-dependent dioxygenase [Colletotrichum sp. SAR 10_66]|nr:putative 2-oxoglutarate-dependent dioxygenase [Colletotrichum sp. SAR 10_66]
MVMPQAHTFTEIPRIDLSLASDPATEPILLNQLRDALINIGFLYVINHGVPEVTISNVVEALPTLFALPAGAKDEIALRNSPHFLGYSGDGSETTAGKSDRREQVEFATELENVWREGVPLRERLRGPNQWPYGFPELRPIIEAYIAEMTGLGERFLHLVAKALSLPPDTFLPFLSDQHRLKLVHYPGLPQSEAGGQGVGPHKDSSGWWTFLLQASPPHIKGLQALNKNGNWIDVPVLPGSFVVNIGQAFEVVTNGVCKATTHRVLSGSLERFSVPFFQGVRRNLTKEEAVGTLREHFEKPEIRSLSLESEEGREIDSAFLKGKYDTWGENQLRTKIRSHRDVGQKFYADVFDKYVNDDQ